MKLIINKQNPKEMEIIFQSHEELDSIKMATTVKKRNHRWVKEKYGKWNGEISFLRKDRFLPIQLWQLVYKVCVKNDFEFDYEELKPYIKLKVDKKFIESSYRKIIESVEGLEFDQDQLNSIIQILRYKHNKMDLSVSYGKSLIIFMVCYYLVEKHGEKIIIINPKPTLNSQMYAEFVKLSKPFPTFVNKVMFTSSGTDMGMYEMYDVVITNFQYAHDKDDTHFHKFTSSFVDEVHRASSMSYKKILKKCKNVLSTRGATGTLLNDHTLETLSIICASGFTNKVVTKREIIDKGRATDGVVLVKFIEPLGLEEQKALKTFYVNNKEYLDRLNMEKKLIRDSKDRLNFIIKDSMKLLRDKGGNCIVFFKDVKNRYGKKIFEGYQKVNQPSFYIDQDTKEADRQKIYSILRKETGYMLLCSYDIGSTGTSINTLTCGYLAEPTKSEITIGQMIGRFMRKHDDKEKFYLVDPVDLMPLLGKQNYCEKWYTYSRLPLYKKDGFEIKTEKVTLKSKLF